MCGRYANNAKWRDLVKIMRLPAAQPAEDPTPAFNIAPTQMGWVILPDEVTQMKWGLLPPWAKDAKIAYSTINARVESIATKPAFRGAWKASQRCLVMASGYYEWPVIDGVKRPHFIHRTDAPVILFGGIWEQRGDLRTYSIVTKDADANIARLHDRMPLVLPAELLDDWLTGSVDDAMAIAQARPAQPMAFYEVDRAVGNVRNQGPQLMEPLAS